MADGKEESQHVTLDLSAHEEEATAEQLNSNGDIEAVPLSTSSPTHSIEREKEIADDVPWASYRLRQEEETPFLVAYDGEGDGLVSKSEEHNQTSSSNNELVNNNNIPSIYDAISQFENEGDFLTSKQAPPSVQQSPQQEAEHKYIEELKLGLAEEDIKGYLEEFEAEFQSEILMIGSIGLEDVQNEEKKLREDHISFQERLTRQQQERKEELVAAMERAKMHVMKRFKEKHRQVQMREEHMLQKDRLIQDKIHRAFRRSEDQLLTALQKRKGEVQTMYGDLTFADGQYGGSRGRRWKVDWNKTPQPIQVKLHCLRGVKDKLPGSRYVMMVSLYDRLGGHVMKWAGLKGQQWGGATLPLVHRGEFFSVEMELDQSVFTVCPSQPDIRPGMVLMFELFILRGSVTPTDRVAAWGCFPVCDGKFNVIEGQYKTPMLRGDMDPSVDKFETIEKLMASDLDHWLCNLYFEIVKLPRYMAGQREYEVELQFSAGLVGFPDRLSTGETAVDGQKPIMGSQSELGSRLSLLSSRPVSGAPSSQCIAKRNSPSPGPSSALVAKAAAFEGDTRKSSLMLPQLDSGHSDATSLSSSNLRRRRKSIVSRDMLSVGGGSGLSRPCTVHGSRKIIEKHPRESQSESDSDIGDDDEVHGLHNDTGFKPVRGQQGLFCKLYFNSPADTYAAQRICTILPKTKLLGAPPRRRHLTHEEKLEQHTFHIRSKWSNSKGHIPKRGREKMQYIVRMLLSELGLTQVKSRDFWAMMLVLLLTWWIRLYLHYLGQWMYLQAIRIPINRFQLLPYTVNLNYQNTLLRTREELGMVVIGPSTNILVLVLFLLLASFVRALFGRFSNIFSRFIMAFGINSFLDPIWIAIVDSAMLRFKRLGGDTPIGDAFKLYWHFDRYYNNDNVSLFVSIGMTLFLYSVTSFAAATILYMYFLKLHNNARLMDVYWRLQGSHDDFFLPYDLEITNEELQFICRKAEQWRGKDGERRKTTVHDYEWEEEQASITKETTSHVAIYTVHLDGWRELYRHFLRLPNGTVVEVFGEMSMRGVNDELKETLRESTRHGVRSAHGDNNFLDISRRVSDASSVDQSSRRSSVRHLDVPSAAESHA